MRQVLNPAPMTFAHAHTRLLSFLLLQRRTKERKTRRVIWSWRKRTWSNQLWIPWSSLLLLRRKWKKRIRPRGWAKVKITDSCPSPSPPAHLACTAHKEKKFRNEITRQRLMGRELIFFSFGHILLSRLVSYFFSFSIAWRLLIRYLWKEDRPKEGRQEERHKEEEDGDGGICAKGH